MSITSKVSPASPAVATSQVAPAYVASTQVAAARVATTPAALAAELRVSLMRTVRRLRAEKSDKELTDGQYAVLAYLDRVGPATPRSLAEYERVKPPSMTRTLASLVEAGLVARQGHPDDGRQVLVRLTSEGRDTVRETQRRRDVWLARRLADLDPAERQVLADATHILRRIADR